MTRSTDSGDEEPLSHQEIGELGEQLARTWLLQRGWKILYRNYRAKNGGEVDIVCRDRDSLMFVEVKTRTTLDYGRPIDAVGPDKQQLIVRGAMDWLRRLNLPEVNFRFDVMEVILEEGKRPQLNLVQNAFQLPEPYFY